MIYRICVEKECGFICRAGFRAINEFNLLKCGSELGLLFVLRVSFDRDRGGWHLGKYKRNPNENLLSSRKLRGVC